MSFYKIEEFFNDGDTRNLDDLQRTNVDVVKATCPRSALLKHLKEGYFTGLLALAHFTNIVTQRDENGEIFRNEQGKFVREVWVESGFDFRDKQLFLAFRITKINV